MKTCSNSLCKQDNPQPDSNFHKSSRSKSGLQSRCKDCRASYFSSLAYLEKRKKWDKEYRQSDKSKIVQKRYLQSSKGKQARSKARQKSRQQEHIKKARRLEAKRHRENNRQKVRARHAVSTAVASKKLPKASSLKCTFCFGNAQEYHHYKGYEEKHKFDIIPVCVPCHNAIHQPLSKEEIQILSTLPVDSIVE